MYGGRRFTVRVVCQPAPLLDRLLCGKVSGDLADSTRQLVRDAALMLLLSQLDLLSVATRVPSWISGDGETCEVRHLFAGGFRQ